MGLRRALGARVGQIAWESVRQGLRPVWAGVLLGTYVGSLVALMVSLTVATGMGLVASAGRFSAYASPLKRLAGVVMIVAGVGQLYLAIFVLDAL